MRTVRLPALPHYQERKSERSVLLRVCFRGILRQFGQFDKKQRYCTIVQSLGTGVVTNTGQYKYPLAMANVLGVKPSTVLV